MLLNPTPPEKLCDAQGRPSFLFYYLGKERAFWAWLLKVTQGTAP